MRLQNALKTVALALTVLFGGLLGGVFTASAGNQQDYCIKCSNPEQTYICRIVSSGAQTQGKQFLCILNIAKENGHDSCTATAEGTSCSGVLVQYDLSGMAPPLETMEQTAIPDAPTNQTKVQNNGNDEPKTLVEFTKEATKATKKSINSAGRDTGKAIKNTGSKIKHFTNKVGRNIKKATKNTFECITSLFSSCGND